MGCFASVVEVRKASTIFRSTQGRKELPILLDRCIHVYQVTSGFLDCTTVILTTGRSFQRLIYPLALISRLSEAEIVSTDSLLPATKGTIVFPCEFHSLS